MTSIDLTLGDWYSTNQIGRWSKKHMEPNFTDSIATAKTYLKISRSFWWKYSKLKEKPEKTQGKIQKNSKTANFSWVELPKKRPKISPLLPAKAQKESLVHDFKYANLVWDNKTQKILKWRSWQQIIWQHLEREYFHHSLHYIRLFCPFSRSNDSNE